MVATQELKRITRSLTALATARKYIQFYPANNPNVKSALNQLIHGLEFLFTGAGNSDAAPRDGNRSIAPDGLLLTIERDRYYYGDEEVGAESRPVRKLAADMYRYRMKSLHILPGVSKDELHRFLELMCLSTEVAEEKGGVLKVLSESNIEHIVVSIAEELVLLDRDQLPADIDMLAYLQGLKGESSGGGESHTRLSAGQKDVSDIARFFHDITDGDEEKRRYLYRTLTDPKRLADALGHIYDIENEAVTEDSGTDDKAMSFDTMRTALANMMNSISALPEEIREDIVQNMAEAVLTTDSRVREEVVKTSLSPAVGRGGTEDTVLSALTDDEILSAVSDHVRLHDGTANTISNFLDEFSGDPRRRSAIQHMLVTMFAEDDDERLREVAELLDVRLEAPIETPEQPSDDEDLAIDHEQRAQTTKMLAMRDEDIDQIELNIERDFVSMTLANATRILFELFISPGPDGVSPETQRHFNGLMAKVLDHGNFVLLGQIIQTIVEELGADEQSRVRPLVRTILKQCAYRQHIDAITDQLRNMDDSSTDYKTLVYFLGLMGDSSAELLFLRLEVEKSRNARMFITSLLAQLGESRIPFFVRKLAHRDWYVVRNVAYILGLIGSDAALEELNRIIQHEDTRVRGEAVRALAHIKGEAAESMLVACLDNADTMIRQQAAEWLGHLHAKCAMPAFRDLIGRHSKELLRDTEFAVSVIRAIGRMGSPSEIPLLKKITPRQTLIGGAKRRDLAEACTEALGQIEKRHGVGVK